MKYENKRHGFSFEVPNDWKKQKNTPPFIISGGRIAYESRDGNASLNVTTDKINKNDIYDQFRRSLDMSNFLRSSPMHIEDVKAVKNFALDGENNTVYLKYISQTKIANGRMISSFHNGDEYVIHAGSTGGAFQEASLDRIIDSFRFVKKKWF